jgi:hypothetical protein
LTYFKGIIIVAKNDDNKKGDAYVHFYGIEEFTKTNLNNKVIHFYVEKEIIIM